MKSVFWSNRTTAKTTAVGSLFAEDEVQHSMSVALPYSRHRLPAEARDAIVNVASVPLRSPFRYPGGKTWFVPYVRLWLRYRSRRPALLVEPFAGGGIVSLTAVFEDLVDAAFMVEMDEAVAAVWEAILNGHGMWLADRILSFEMTETSVRELLRAECLTVPHRALQTIVRNRVSRGGIMAPGAGMVKQGENNRGLRSRWYPETLASRVRAIADMRDRLRFVHGDGIAAMEDHRRNDDAVFFVDPPYTVAGRRLYTHNTVDHERLFRLAADVAGDVVMTYDDSREVALLAERHGFAMRRIPMKTTHHDEKYELLIGRDLSWVDDTPPAAGRRDG